MAHTHIPFVSQVARCLTSHHSFARKTSLCKHQRNVHQCHVYPSEVLFNCSLQTQTGQPTTTSCPAATPLDIVPNQSLAHTTVTTNHAAVERFVQQSNQSAECQISSKHNASGHSFWYPMGPQPAVVQEVQRISHQPFHRVEQHSTDMPVKMNTDLDPYEQILPQEMVQPTYTSSGTINFVANTPGFSTPMWPGRTMQNATYSDTFQAPVPAVVGKKSPVVHDTYQISLADHIQSCAYQWPYLRLGVPW